MAVLLAALFAWASTGSLVVQPCPRERAHKHARCRGTCRQHMRGRGPLLERLCASPDHYFSGLSIIVVLDGKMILVQPMKGITGTTGYGAARHTYQIEHNSTSVQALSFDEKAWISATPSAIQNSISAPFYHSFFSCLKHNAARIKDWVSPHINWHEQVLLAGASSTALLHSSCEVWHRCIMPAKRGSTQPSPWMDIYGSYI
eukprot:scaffold117247_cov17-Tisochrysis_lutea.AAC.1